MKKALGKLTVLFMLAALIFSPIKTEAQEGSQAPDHFSSPSAFQLKSDLRKLWIEHTIWERSYFVSAIAELEDQNKVLTRLLKNQDDIGNAIKPYYGEAAGNKLGKLLREHILIAGKLVDAAKKGDQANIKKYNTEWHKNADDIAQFLSSANPNWSKNDLKNLLYMHLDFAAAQVVARIKKDWDADIRAFDQGEDHVIKLADTLTNGIVKQFPNKF